MVSWGMAKKPLTPRSKPAMLPSGTFTAPKGKHTVPTGDQRLTVNLPQDLHLKLKVHTAQTRTNMSDVVVQLVKDYLAHV